MRFKRVPGLKFVNPFLVKRQFDIYICGRRDADLFCFVDGHRIPLPMVRKISLRNYCACRIIGKGNSSVVMCKNLRLVKNEEFDGHTCLVNLHDCGGFRR